MYDVISELEHLAKSKDGTLDKKPPQENRMNRVQDAGRQ